MMTDTPESVTLVPIDRIEVLNSRDRNMKVFEEIVENIRSIGLKKPITVTEREGADGAAAYAHLKKNIEYHIDANHLLSNFAALAMAAILNSAKHPKRPK